MKRESEKGVFRKLLGALGNRVKGKDTTLVFDDKARVAGPADTGEFSRPSSFSDFSAPAARRDNAVNPSGDDVALMSKDAWDAYAEAATKAVQAEIVAAENRRPQKPARTTVQGKGNRSETQGGDKKAAPAATDTLSQRPDGVGSSSGTLYVSGRDTWENWREEEARRASEIRIGGEHTGRGAGRDYGALKSQGQPAQTAPMKGPSQRNAEDEAKARAAAQRLEAERNERVIKNLKRTTAPRP